MLGDGFTLLTSKNVPTSCTQSCGRGGGDDYFSHFHVWRDSTLWSLPWISVSWSHSRRSGCRAYLANVLVVAACVLLLQEKLVPHPTSSHSLQQLLSSERFQCSLSIQGQRVQRQAQAEKTQHGQWDSPHPALRVRDANVTSILSSEILPPERADDAVGCCPSDCWSCKKKKRGCVSLYNTKSVNKERDDDLK